jgi:putative endonuclease
VRARLTPERRLAEVRGREGEAAAAQWLVQQGWEIADERRLARVAAAAEVVMHRYAAAGEDVRIDVILLAPGRRPYHIANAWMP